MRSFVPLAVLSFVSAPMLLASTVVVSKTGAITTIQGGVDAALAGDTVAIDDGTYAENVIIPSGKTGLRLISTGKVLLEARKANGVGGGPGLTVSASGVLVKGLTIRNALENSSGATNGDGIRVLAADFTAQAVTIVGCADAGILVSNVANAKLKSVTIRACEIGVRAVGMSDLKISNSHFIGTQSVGIHLNGCIDPTISKCSFEGCGGSGGIANQSGLSTGVTVKDCEFETVSGLPIFLDGDDFTVSRCRITHSASGIHVADGGGKIDGNTLFGLRDDALGISLEFGSSVQVFDNEIEECSGEGILLRDSPDNEVRGNRIQNCAYEGESAIRVDATSRAQIDANQIEDCGGTGIELQGVNSTVEENSIKRCLLDGIHVASAATGSIVDGNFVDRCNAEGLDQRASSAIIRFNVFKRCRLDLTNVGTATFQNNVFKTGGTNVPFEID